MTSSGPEAGMLTRILGAIDEYVYVGEILPGDGYRLLFQGPCRELFLGMEAEAAAEAVWADHVHPEDREHFTQIHRDALERGSLDGEYRLVGADGVTRWVRDRGRIRVEDGRTLLDGSILDVTAIHAVQEELRATVEQLERLGRLDPLTGVSNRRVLPEVLDRRLDGGGAGVGILMLDIDRFKAINDEHGHAAGDAVIVEIADRVRRSIRADDVLARVGGEEFLVLLGGIADEAALRRVGETIRQAVAASPLEAGAIRLPVTASVGAALSRGEHRAHATLLAAADRALYAAKRAGRNRVVVLGDEPVAGQVEHDPAAAAAAHALAVATGAHDRERELEATEVARLAAEVGRRLGLAPEVVERVRLAGLVRDVGRIGVPDQVLTEAGPLDERQWAAMRRHAEDGASMIAAVPELRHLAPAVRHHHERVDGEGYPAGLSGAAIPLEARIVAAADAYCAMRRERPYRGARTAAHARAELRRVAGSQLDPDVVTALLAVLAA